MAAVDWATATATAALAAGELPCSSGERRILELAASLAASIPVDRNDAVAGLDRNNIQRLVIATRHASGQRQPCEPYDLHHTSDPAIETPTRPEGHATSSRSTQARRDMQLREHRFCERKPGQLRQLTACGGELPTGLLAVAAVDEQV